MLENLNSQQEKAVTLTQGPMLVMAGAGSGKTKVLTTKIAYLIKEKNIAPWNILAITFTNKAASEMKERIEGLLGAEANGMWVGTFHSVGVRVLRMGAEKLGYTSDFTIYDRADQITLLKEVYKKVNVSDKTFTHSSALTMISKAKNQGVSPEKFVSVFGNEYRTIVYSDIYQEYERLKSENNAFDFDDLIVKTNELLEKEVEIRNYYQEKFRYIFVDEYQDTNPGQYKMVRSFTGDDTNICVVGDIDQSIYGWRGADISNITDFEKDFPGAQVVVLEENYRSTQPILDAANKVIKNNPHTHEKELWSSISEGDKPSYQEFFGEEAEAKDVISKIESYLQEGESLSEMAILYRTNAQSRLFEEYLVHAKIPYTIVGGLKFYERKEVKDVLAYLRVLSNPKDDLAFSRIINEPKRGIGQVSLDKILNSAAAENMSAMAYVMAGGNPLTGKGKEGLEDFYKSAKKAKKLIKEENLSSAVEKIIDLTGIPNTYREEDTVESRTRLENIDSFISSVLAYEEENPDDGLDDYLAGVSLMSDVDKTEDSEEGIKLMTLHSAKGLEFKIVFLTGLEEGLFPSKYSIDEDNVEEERRLFYVGVTRAERQLHISSSCSRRIFGQQTACVKSRFIDELGDTVDLVDTWNDLSPASDGSNFARPFASNEKNYFKRDLLERKKRMEANAEKAFKLGDKVEHPSFGIGTIINLEEKDSGDMVLVSFENQGLKKLKVDVAPLEKI